MILNDYVKEQLCDSLWQGLLATWLPTQQLKQNSNDVIYEVFKFGLHMIRNMPIVSNKYYSGVMCLWTRFILIILLLINVQENWVQWIYGFVHCVK